MRRKQRTIAQEISVSGIGLHSGKRVSTRLCPASPNTGVIFIRSDLEDSPQIRAVVERVASTERSTDLASSNSARIRGVEHLLAVLNGLSIDNLLIYSDSIELPAMDGSALPFAELISRAGIEEQGAEVEILSLSSPVWSVRGGSYIVALPDSTELKLSYLIDFTHPAIGTQFGEISLAPEVEVKRELFFAEIAGARTIGFEGEVEILRSRGLALGGSLDNALVFGKNGEVLNPSLRFSDEPVRHKLLDLMGDLYLVGYNFNAHIIAIKASHFLHIELARKIRSILPP